MRSITLANGDTVPVLGLGTWFLGDNPAGRQEEIAALRCGIEGGARLIDTAEMYGSGRSEELVGEAITPFSRESLYLITKVLPSNASRHRMEAALDASLARLGTDYVDMYLYHWRGGTPLAETVAELERLRGSGKIRSWGVSNFDVEDMQDLAAVPGGAHCQANEVLYHLGSRGIEVELRGLLERRGAALIAYCPLAQAGTLRNGYSEDWEISEPGIRCVAAPIRNASGNIAASISVSSAVIYMGKARMRELAAASAHLGTHLNTAMPGEFEQVEGLA
ncbi:aldo/keto reductase, partial [Actinotignum timonense]|nr:aldo/keto reductase [Actinotignum timonense]